MILPPLPATLAPPVPFPAISAQSHVGEFVAPGVRRATYRLQTTDGPLVVNVVAIDVREPTLRLRSVIANDRLVSAGETVSSMADRTGAIAGINADYFDIGNTNQPLNLVVSDGALLRTPSKRAVLDVRTDGSVHYDTVSFSGTVRYRGTNVPLTGINEWPPQGGASYLTPAYGALKAAAGVRVAELVPADPAHVASRVSGNYRVASIGDARAERVSGTLLAFGPAAQALAPPPLAGDTVTLEAALSPSLDGMANAVGGGPLLVSGGAPVDDPNAPAPEERDRRMPVSGAGSTRADELLLVAVDGRRREQSIGLTRPEFGALLRAFGAVDGMAFDSGGSATLVARVLGDRLTTPLNAPSDGSERLVADGLFAYSSAPAGPPALLVVRPSPILTVAHAAVPVRVAVVDAAGHALGATHLAGGDVVRAGNASSNVSVRAGKLSAQIPVEVVPRLARLDIAAVVRAAERDAPVHFEARGYDARGRAVDLGDAVRWSADRGTFSSPGTYRGANRDARIVARAAGLRADFILRVGRHRESFPLFDAPHAAAWRFTSAPQGSRGSLDVAPQGGELRLHYDFTASRAAYAGADIAIPGVPLAFAVEILGDGSRVGLRAAFVNRFGERRALTLANAVDWSGWQERTVAIPPDLNPPVRLVALYAVAAPQGSPNRTAGTLAFRNASVDLAGSR